MSSSDKTQRTLDADKLVARLGRDELVEFMQSKTIKDAHGCAIWQGNMNKGKEPAFNMFNRRFYVRDVVTAMKIAAGEDRQQGTDIWVIKPQCEKDGCVSPACLKAVSRKAEQRKRGKAAGKAAAKEGRVGEEARKMQRYSKASVVCLLCGDRVWDTKYFRNQHSKRCSVTAETGEKAVELQYEPVAYKRCTKCDGFVINRPDDIVEHNQSCKGAAE